MNTFPRKNILHLLIVLAAFILSSCKDAIPSTLPPVAETPSPASSETASSAAMDVETPQSSGERTLVYCTPWDLESLYPFSSKVVILSIFLQTIYDGPIDSRSYDYQPVILKKLPSLADGDAQLVPVNVAVGDPVVDANSDVVVLGAGMRVRPSGCQSDECAIEYDGTSPLQMDQLVARFELLPGLLWSDGTPLTASDSVYAFNLQGDPDTPSYKGVIARTASYEALNDVTVVWTGLPGYLDSTYFLNFFGPYPKHVWGQYTAEELLTAEVSTQKPLGWGPYVVEEFNPDEGIILRKNENYFRRDEGLPHFDRLELRFVERDVNANLALLLSGECDVLSNITLSALDDKQQDLLLELDNVGQINASFIAGTRFEHLDFGIQPASYDDGWQPGDRPDFFSDVNVRRAFAYCMDRQQMLEVASLSQSLVTDTYIPPQHPLYNPDVTHYDFDPAAGSALLEEAGWVTGQDGVRVYQGDNERIPPNTRLSVTHYTLEGTSQASVNVMVASLKECGIEVETSYWNPEQLFADGPTGAVIGRQFDLAQFRWLTGVNPPCGLWVSENIPGEDLDSFPFGWDGQNNTGFSDPEYDQACRNAYQSLPGQPGYEENHLRAQEIFSEQLPVIMLYFNTYAGATRPDFCNYILDPTLLVDTWNIEAFNYGPVC
jgi:peptide/nickel transport system substrate-binding protein